MWQTGMTYSGFELISKQDVAELASKAFEFRHVKTGAKLLYLQNDDDNKVFSVTFRTPPQNSTGVPHILEHSVLCGSRKFPMKEPFVELVKGSLNTFLNAMTFADKTMYPVASQNDKDFRNLMDVYLDAVFFPCIYECPEILMQEGWHYELEDKKADLTIKGVVYNEMKGVFSSPEAVLDRKVQEVLFPDTTYGVESGGDPDFIPDLTQKEFLKFHKTYYHPANSYIFLYGAMDLLDQLTFIDQEYLSKFEPLQVDSEIKVQEPFAKTVTATYDYAISANEKEEDKTFLSLNFVVGKATDPEQYLAMQILEHLLLGTPAAPLKQAIIAAGIGKDVFGNFNSSALQTVFTIGVRGVKHPDKAEEFIKVVYHTLQELTMQGIDKKLIEASINIHEFQLREANFGNYPKGLIYNIKCMDSWLYDEDPLMHLRYEESLSAVKAALNSFYFEKIIETQLLDNTHRALVIVKPQKGLAEAKAEEQRQELAKIKNSMTEQELDEIMQQTQKLLERQTTPDSPEALATIPLLELKDLDPKTKVLPIQEKKLGNLKVLHHDLFTNKIAYLKFYFDSSSVKQEQLPYLFLLEQILGKIDTSKYKYTDLSNEIYIHTGGIQYQTTAYAKGADDTIVQPYFKVHSKALLHKVPELLELIKNILLESSFADRKRLKELVQELKSRYSAMMLEQGHLITTSRLLSYVSPLAAYKELGNFTFFRFISELEENFEDHVEELQEKLREVAQAVFRQDGLLISATLNEEDFNQCEKSLKDFYEALPVKNLVAQTYQFELQAQNEGLLTSSKVQYVGQGGNFRRLGFEYHGGLKVIETMMRYDYLWNRIRVQGGAYGAFSSFSRTGNLIFCSYRDPNLEKTFAVYEDVAKYFGTLSLSERELTKYIIGTMSQIDAPLTPSSKGETAAEYYLQGLTTEMLQQERTEILTITPEKLKELGELIEQTLAQSIRCALGAEETIRENETLFKKLVPVFD